MKPKDSAKDGQRIQHKLRISSGVPERFGFPAMMADKNPPLKKTPASLVAATGFVYFDRGEQCDVFRCYDAHYLFETELSNIESLVVVQMYPERGGSGDAYLRLKLKQKIGALHILNVMESNLRYSDYDHLGPQLSEFFGLPLRVTQAYE